MAVAKDEGRVRDGMLREGIARELAKDGRTL
jgi:hypothetical protein